MIAQGIDRTQVLRDLHIPLAPHLRATNETLDRLPRDKWDKLIRLGLAEIEEYDNTGKGMETAPRRALGATDDILLAADLSGARRDRDRAPLQAERRRIGAEFARRPFVRGADVADYKRRYCLDQEFFAAVARASPAAKSEFGVEERIDYILATGANWSGPIRDFRLVVDKGDADSLVSFCGEGVKKIGPTQFEMRKTDFTPQGNISVLILRGRRGSAIRVSPLPAGEVREYRATRDASWVMGCGRP